MSAWPLAGEPLRSHQVPLVVEKMTQLYGGHGVDMGATGLSSKDPLAHLLALQRRHWPQAWVSSTFYDWRTVSKYRRKAGLHLGYDLALPFGTSVSAGWPGVVTSVVPWTDTEYGVTVRSLSGLSATYGHITPTVRVGDKIATGQVVGRIASDHVDVKIRDNQGRYVPFGEGSQERLAVAPTVSRTALLTAWLVAKNSVDQAEEDLFLRRNASRKWQLERRSAENKIRILESSLVELRAPQSEGLVARKTIEQFKAELNVARRQLKRVTAQEKLSSQSLKSSLAANQANLESLTLWANSQGLTWKDVEQLVATTISRNTELRRAVEQEKRRQPASGTITEAELEARRRTLANLESLYLNGGLSRQEIEDERLRLQLLEEEFRLKRRRNQD